MTSVARRGKNGRAARGDAEQHVFDAVERLLSRGESFSGLGVQRIVEEAGIARSSFYANFADKPEMLLRMSVAATVDLFGYAESWWQSDRELSQDALTEMLTSVIAEYRRHEYAQRAMSEVASYDESVASYWRGRIEKFVRVVAQRLERDREHGLVTAEVDIPYTAHWIVWGTERSIAQHVAAGRKDDGRLASSLARSIWWSLYGGPGAA
jgi:TetR/AcrR family transcriptional regulator, ethionamide resistance regulator